MEASQVPALAYVVFGLALGCGLGLFACLFVVTRRLGVEWRKVAGGLGLDAEDTARIGKMLFGAEKAPSAARIDALLMAARVLWLAMVILIIAFAALVAGII